jgi:hypothetical protein
MLVKCPPRPVFMSDLTIRLALAAGAALVTGLIVVGRDEAQRRRLVQQT